MRQADSRMKTIASLRTPTAPAVLAAAEALAHIKKVAENQLATALDVSLGFSDADGD